MMLCSCVGRVNELFILSLSLFGLSPTIFRACVVHSSQARLTHLLFPKSIVKDACKAGEDAVKALLEKALAEAGNDEKKIKGINEYFDIYQDLRGRFQDMMDIMEVHS